MQGGRESAQRRNVHEFKVKPKPPPDALAEITLRELQAMGMTAGINALIVGNYLTTLGRSPEDDLQMLDDLRMPVSVLSKVL